MKIENSDIDALIEVCTWLKTASKSSMGLKEKSTFAALEQHTRKVYVLLLNATGKGQLELKRLRESGIGDYTPTANAIRALCPDLGLN